MAAKNSGKPNHGCSSTLSIPSVVLSLSLMGCCTVLATIRCISVSMGALASMRLVTSSGSGFCVAWFSNAPAACNAAGQPSAYFALIINTGILSCIDKAAVSILIPARVDSSCMLSSKIEGKPRLRICKASESWRSICVALRTIMTKSTLFWLKKWRTTCSSSEKPCKS